MACNIINWPHQLTQHFPTMFTAESGLSVRHTSVSNGLGRIPPILGFIIRPFPQTVGLRWNQPTDSLSLCVAEVKQTHRLTVSLWSWGETNPIIQCLHPKWHHMPCIVGNMAPYMGNRVSFGAQAACEWLCTGRNGSLPSLQGSLFVMFVLVNEGHSGALEGFGSTYSLCPDGEVLFAAGLFLSLGWPL